MRSADSGRDGFGDLDDELDCAFEIERVIVAGTQDRTQTCWHLRSEFLEALGGHIDGRSGLSALSFDGRSQRLGLLACREGHHQGRGGGRDDASRRAERRSLTGRLNRHRCWLSWTVADDRMVSMRIPIGHVHTKFVNRESLLYLYIMGKHK